MSYQIYDEASSSITPFVPVRAGEVSIYECGMTVYAPPHLGHIRKEVVFDVLRRWLTASGYKVRVVCNITDINEKILSNAEAAGVSWFEVAYAVEKELAGVNKALGCLPLTYEPRASGHIPEMI